MSKTTQLAVTGASNITVVITTEGLAERKTLLESAGLVATVSNAEEQDIAATTASQLKAFTKALESSREELKKPILEAGRTLDATAKEAAAPVIKETLRIEGLLADFHKEQERLRKIALAEQERIAAEARRAQEEIERKERARLYEIERQRLAAEEAARNAKSKKDREAAAAEAERLAKQQEEEELAAEFAQPPPAPPVFVAPPATTRAKGASTKEEIFFEVTDIEALYKARPELVELVAREQAIKYVLKTPGASLDILPGVKAWKDVVVITRSAAKPAQLA